MTTEKTPRTGDRGAQEERHCDVVSGAQRKPQSGDSAMSLDRSEECTAGFASGAGANVAAEAGEAVDHEALFRKEYPMAWAALKCVERDWRVFPLHGITPDGRCTCESPRRRSACTQPGKHPRIKDWPKLATTDQHQIITWWVAEFPGSNVGIATGRESGIWVLDVDKQHGGYCMLMELIKRFGYLPQTFTVRTPSGGEHRYFRYPEDGREIQNHNPDTSPLGVGLDTRGWHGYVVGPGSVIYGREYGISAAMPVDDAPAAIVNLVAKHPRQVTEGTGDVHVSGLSLRLRMESAANVTAGQEWYLFTALCAAVTYGWDERHLFAYGREIARRFPTMRAGQPWTENDVIAKVRSALKYRTEEVPA